MSRISTPFGLSERLRKPDMNLDATAIGTVLLIALMLVMLVGSRFVYAPGVTVDLTENHASGVTIDPKENHAPSPLSLPVASPDVRLPGVQTTETLTVLVALKQDDMALWNGQILKLSELEKALSAKPRKPGEILLLKADGAVSMQTFFKVTGLAKKAGFASVQIAGEDAKPER